jgi:Tol biopolymer transport system component
LITETGRGNNWPSVAASGARLAYARRTGGDIELWRLGVSDGVPSGTPAKFAGAWRDEFTPVYSPDGTKVAFTAGRAETSEIWVCGSEGSNCTQLTWTNDANTGNPSWSPDGRFLAYYSTVGGHARIYTVPARGGEARPVTSPDTDAIRPSWSHDGKWIYFTSRKTGRFEVWKISPDGGQAVQVTRTGGYAGIESPDGLWLYYAANGAEASGLWRQRLPDEEPEQVLPAIQFRDFAITGRGIYFVALTDAGPAVQFFDLVTRQVKPVAKLRHGYTGLAAAPDGKTILFADISTAASQIYIVDNFR